MTPQMSPSSISSSSKESIANAAIKFLSNQVLSKRRNAVKYKIGHRIEAVLLKEPTYCSQCDELLWGLVGNECKFCKLRVHSHCLVKIRTPCSVSNYSDQVKREECHLFKPKHFKLPTFCNHCGTLLIGLFKPQGLICDPGSGGCGKVYHRDCKDLAGHCNRGLNDFQIFNKQDCDLQLSKQREQLYNATEKDFELIRVIGTGSSSKVYLAKHKEICNRDFAIKVINKTNASVSMDPKSAIIEMKALNLGREFPFLAIAHCCFQTDARLFFVMEYVAGHDLFYYLQRERKFTEDKTRFYIAEIALTLNYLHSRDIVYRDLKPENVIIDKAGHCKLIDFGLSKELQKTLNMKTRTFCGTPGYISPEMVEEQDYGFSVDWWALGVLTFELLTGYLPFDFEDDEMLYKSIEKEEVQIPKFLSREAQSLLESLLIKNPNKRLGSQVKEGCEQAIFQHPFFKHKFEFDCNQFVNLWDALKAKQIRPPSIPSIEQLVDRSNKHDNEEVTLTPIDAVQLEHASPDRFMGFSFYSRSFYSMLTQED